MAWHRFSILATRGDVHHGLGLALALIVLPVTLDSQQPTFRAGTELVDLYVTVTDRERRLVPDLLQDEFEILDNRRPQEIVLFSNEVRPITVVVMLDTSASMTPSLDLLMAGAEQFLLRLLPQDRGRVGAFNDKIEIVQREIGRLCQGVGGRLPAGFGASENGYSVTLEGL